MIFQSIKYNHRVDSCYREFISIAKIINSIICDEILQ